MANTTTKFDSIINFLRSRSSAVVKNAINDLAFEGLLCVHQFRTDHALNQALNVLKTVQGGNTVIRYWRDVSPFQYSNSEGFHGKMKEKKWDVYKVPSFSAWKEAQKKANKKTPYEQLMAIINKDEFFLTPVQFAEVLKGIAQFEGELPKMVALPAEDK